MDLDAWIAEAEKDCLESEQPVSAAPAVLPAQPVEHITERPQEQDTKEPEQAAQLSGSDSAESKPTRIYHLVPKDYCQEVGMDEETASSLMTAEGGWRYFWSPEMLEPTLPVRRSRGKQLRKARSASFFTGTAAESAGHQATGIAEDVVFTCDSAVSSWQWILGNGPHGGCHFTDARQLIDEGHCFCCRHNQICHLENLNCDDLDEFSAGFLCTPYSLARTRRREGTREHPDADLYEKTINFVARFQPRRCELESVYGFLCPEKAGAERAPIYDFLDFCAEKIPNYHVTVYVTPGNTHLWFDRARCYISLIRNDVGGARAAERQRKLVTVP